MRGRSDALDNVGTSREAGRPVHLEAADHVRSWRPAEGPARRAAAIGALALAAAAVVVGAIGLVGDVGRLIVALVLPAVLAAAAWIAATRKGGSG